MSVYEHELWEQDKPPENLSKKSDFDKDRLLILAIIFLMLRNGGDLRLIIALGYIIIGRN